MAGLALALVHVLWLALVAAERHRGPDIDSFLRLAAGSWRGASYTFQQGDTEPRLTVGAAVHTEPQLTVEAVAHQLELQSAQGAASYRMHELRVGTDTPLKLESVKASSLAADGRIFQHFSLGSWLLAPAYLVLHTTGQANVAADNPARAEHRFAFCLAHSDGCRHRLDVCTDGRRLLSCQVCVEGRAERGALHPLAAALQGASKLSACASRASGGADGARCTLAAEWSGGGREVILEGMATGDGFQWSVAGVQDLDSSADVEADTEAAAETEPTHRPWPPENALRLPSGCWVAVRFEEASRSSEEVSLGNCDTLWVEVGAACGTEAKALSIGYDARDGTLRQLIFRKRPLQPTALLSSPRCSILRVPY